MHDRAVVVGAGSLGVLRGGMLVWECVAWLSHCDVWELGRYGHEGEGFVVFVCVEGFVERESG